MEQRIIATNPTKGCALPKLGKKEMKILPLDCLATFFEEAKRSGVFELYYIDLSTGLRRGELLGLKWSDIDLKKGIISKSYKNPRKSLDFLGFLALKKTIDATGNFSVKIDFSVFYASVSSFLASSLFSPAAFSIKLVTT